VVNCLYVDCCSETHISYILLQIDSRQRRAAHGLLHPVRKEMNSRELTVHHVSQVRYEWMDGWTDRQTDRQVER
jgi:hypothetical protein